MKILSDLHVHTTASRCCHDENQRAENIMATLKSLGMERIGFTDHLWALPGYPPNAFYQGQNGDKNLSLKELIDSRDDWGVDILVGCEADMTAPGIFGITPELREKLDYVILASNHFHIKGFVEPPEAPTPEAVGRHMLKFFLSAATSGLCDILAHPLFPCGYTDVYDRAVASISDAEFFDAFASVAAVGVGMEINPCFYPNPEKKRFFSVETPTRFLLIAKAAGCKFSFGSDAHQLLDFAPALERLRYFAEALDLTDDDLHPLAKRGR